MVRPSKLVNSIDFGLEKEYNLAEVFVDLEKLDANNTDNFGDYSQPMIGSVQPCINPSLVVC